MAKTGDEKPITRREMELLLEGHGREHDLHDKAHFMEHQMTSEALNKADRALEIRLEGMNEFRAQLEKQAGAFLTREVFEQFIKELTEKTERALITNADKYDTIIKAIVNRQDTDSDSLSSAIQESKESIKEEVQQLRESLKTEIQQEREYRKTFEGSINTWKWIATFLGASGVAGVILMFATGQS